MTKGTVYLPETVKRDLARVARTEGLSESELIRTAVREFLIARSGRRPKLPLFTSGQPGLAQRTAEALAGFGDHAV